MTRRISGGLVHELRPDLIKALTETREIANRWESLTPIARNEFVCWVDDAKQEKTRAKRIRRTVEELLEGQKRPLLGRLHTSHREETEQMAARCIDRQDAKAAQLAMRRARRPVRQPELEASDG